MSLEVIDAQRVKALLPMQECIDVMAQAIWDFRAEARELMAANDGVK